MDGERGGFLMVMMQPPPAFEDEFNAWYDTEHLPERMAVPGFVAAHRYVCVDGHPRYLAMYDMTAHDILETPEYLAVSADRFSPWTRRVTSRVLVNRIAGVQLYPGAALTGRSVRVLLLRFRGVAHDDASDLVDTLRQAYEGRPETVALRVFACEEGLNHYAYVELRAPVSPGVDLARLGRFAAALDLVNSYAPYDPRL